MENMENENDLEKELAKKEILEKEKDKEKTEEFQRYIINSEILKDAFLSLAGYRTEIIKEKKKILNTEVEVEKKVYVVDKEKAIINEKGAYYLYSNIYPLINQLTTSGNLNEREIYRLYRTKVITLIFALLDNYYFENNTFELKMEYFPDIVSFICSFYAITLKARQGFTLKTLSESVSSIFISKPATEEKGKGLFGLFKK